MAVAGVRQQAPQQGAGAAPVAVLPTGPAALLSARVGIPEAHLAFAALVAVLRTALVVPALIAPASPPGFLEPFSVVLSGPLVIALGILLALSSPAVVPAPLAGPAPLPEGFWECLLQWWLL